MMTSNDANISLPVSQIRSPGGHRLKMASRARSVAEQKEIHSKLFEFKEKVSDKESSASQLSNQIKMRSFQNLKPVHPLTRIMNCHSSTDIIGPGLLKDFTNKIQDTMHLAHEILRIYHIQLILQISKKQSLDLYNALRFLIPEICVFKPSLFQTLKISQVVLYDGEEDRVADAKADSTSFFIQAFTTHEKLTNRLYKIILNHMIRQNPDILTEWEADQGDDDHLAETLVKGPCESLEETFQAMMRNKNYTVDKEKMSKLKGLLMKFYPEDLSAEWFDTKKDAKKQLLRVKFDLKDQ